MLQIREELRHLNAQIATNQTSLDAYIVERLQQSIPVINVVLKVQIKMAQVVATLKIMPKSPETDISLIQGKAQEEIKKFVGETEMKFEQEPIAFGLTALKIIFVMDESKGSIDPLEEEIKKIEGVSSVETIDVRRAIG